MYDLIIIGAGPAGLTAAIYAGRFRLKALMLEKSSVGGQIILSATIENFPGFPGGIKTSELVEKMRKQVEEVKVDLDYDEVIELIVKKEENRPIFLIKTINKVYESKAVIIAVGAQPKRLGIEGEERLTGRGVSYCATCDGPLFQNKEVVVIGGGDKAIEEAIFLSTYAKKVILVHRRDKLRATAILQEKAFANPKIEFIFNTIAEKIIGEERTEEIELKNLQTQKNSRISCQGVFIFVGIQPQTSFLKRTLQINANDFIITDQLMQTSQPGIFACGDCREKSLYQVVSACAEGALACDSAFRYLLGG